MYYYFQKILAWVREVLARMFKQESATLQMNLDLILTPRIAFAMNLWALMYVNLPPWTVAEDGETPNGVVSLNLPASIANELARTVTVDMACDVDGSDRADYLHEQAQRILRDIRVYTEYACAKGGLIMKPYLDGDALRVDFVQADMFYPLAFNSDGRLVTCCFVDTKQEGSNFYKRFEYHTLEAGGVRIKNWAFHSTARDMLGDEVPLTRVVGWADIEPEVLVEGVDRPLFAYLRMPFANNIDPLSPIGVSCFARAVDIIKATDELWNSLQWEMESGKRALFVDKLAFGTDKRTGLPRLPSSRLYRSLDTGGQDDDFFKEWSPSLREQNYINAIEANYRMIEFLCGIAEGSLPRPAALQLATATEVKMTRQRTYSTVSDVQRALQTALEDLLYAMDTWASVYELAPEGQYEAKFSFDDSIVHDKTEMFAENLQAIGARVMGRVEFRVKQYGETEATAKAAIARVDAEVPGGLFPSPGAEPGEFEGAQS